MKDHNYYVYMITNWNNRVLYIGVTNDVGSGPINNIAFCSP